MRNKEWPDGSLKLVSRRAYDAVRRARVYQVMTRDERLAAAQALDALARRGRRAATLEELIEYYQEHFGVGTLGGVIEHFVRKS